VLKEMYSEKANKREKSINIYYADFADRVVTSDNEIGIAMSMTRCPGKPFKLFSLADLYLHRTKIIYYLYIQ